MLRITEIRAKKGWSQTDLARESGITQGTLSRIESGAQEPRAQTLIKLADALNVKYTDLLESGAGPPGRRSGIARLMVELSELDWVMEELPSEKKAALLEFVVTHMRPGPTRQLLQDAVKLMDEGAITRIRDIFQHGGERGASAS